MTNYPNPHDRPADLLIWFNPDGTADIVDRIHRGEFGANTCSFKLTREEADSLIALGSVIDAGQARRGYEWKETR